MVKNGSPKGIEDIKKRLGTDSNVTFVSCTYSLQELKELNAKLQVSLLRKLHCETKLGGLLLVSDLFKIELSYI